MKITMEADYALRIIYCLAKDGGKVDAKTISESISVTLRFAQKILRKLVMAGIVKSYKGINGGYQLMIPLADITLLMIIEEIDGEISINRCLSDQCACTRVGDKHECPFNKEFNTINKILRDELQKVNFADILLIG